MAAEVALMSGEAKAERGEERVREKKGQRERVRCVCICLSVSFFGFPPALTQARGAKDVGHAQLLVRFLSLARVLRIPACLRVARLAVGSVPYRGSWSPSKGVLVCVLRACQRGCLSSAAVVAQRHMRRIINGWTSCGQWYICAEEKRPHNEEGG